MNRSLLSFIMLALLFPFTLWGGEAIRDDGNFLNPEAKQLLTAKIAALEAETSPPQRIYLVTKNEVRGDMEAQIKQAAPSGRFTGLYIFMSRSPKKLVLIPSKGNKNTLSGERLAEIRAAMLAQFRSNNYGEGLNLGLSQIGATFAKQAARPLAAQANNQVSAAPYETDASPFWQRILITLAIVFGCLGLFRFIANLRRPRPPLANNYSAAPYGGGQASGPGGYGGGGGGMFQSIFGGIAGAMAGNWMYDKFFGQGSAHGTTHDQFGSSSLPGEEQSNQQQGWDYDHSSGDFSSGNDWGDSSGSDDSGNDW